MAQKVRGRTITNELQYTDAVELTGYFNVSLSGTWDAIVTAQRSFDKGNTWFDVKIWTENVQEYGFEPEKGVYYRFGVKTAEFNTGSIVIRASQ